MTFYIKERPELRDRHAILSPSQPYWLRYTEEKMLHTYDKRMEAALGTRKHEWAKETIELGIVQIQNSKTLNLYINECIGHRMQVEKVVFYSYNAFGTCDAIRFEPDGMVLRIFDLKTGEHKVTGEQLIVYAAYFCLEYGIEPKDLTFDLRIFQNDSMIIVETTAEEIELVMEVTVRQDELLKIEQARGL